MPVFGIAHLFDNRMREFVDDAVEHYLQRVFLCGRQRAKPFATALQFIQRKLMHLAAQNANDCVEIAFG